jgi:hypothetical protein
MKHHLLNIAGRLGLTTLIVLPLVLSGGRQWNRTISNYRTVSKSFTANGHFRGTYRNATPASSQLNGSSLGSSLYSQLFVSIAARLISAAAAANITGLSAFKGAWPVVLIWQELSLSGARSRL